MVVLIWSGFGILTPVVALLGGLIGYYISYLLLPDSWHSADLGSALVFLIVSWVAGIAHLIFQVWLDERGSLDEASFFFIPAIGWTGLFFVIPVLWFVFKVLVAGFYWIF